ncbi:ornithine cyclodeaminase [Amylibacter sp.]|nr:ornithine cyclodeaminase [Amylibacter sp.]MDB2537684.1 ornithine cyclodeaminase [Amylibacter sp.]MDC1042106.1 ornithine cyclodeaminase [Amylibacter sp.]
MSLRMITYKETKKLVSWLEAMDALRAGHFLKEAQVGDTFLGSKNAVLLSRSAFIEGLGYGVKAVTAMAENSKRGLPTVQGAMMVYEPITGELSAIIESKLITEIKTASDSILGAKLLARENSKHLLIIGAGTVAESLIYAYSKAFPDLEKITIWARNTEKAEILISKINGLSPTIETSDDIALSAFTADIISTATMAHEPVLKGKWVKPGTHIDLIGAFTSDMREADDFLMSSGSIFVDSRATTIEHIGELTIPISNGIISKNDIKGDFYDLIPLSKGGRKSNDEITIFKNGGGAHLDLMIAKYLIEISNNSIS